MSYLNWEKHGILFALDIGIAQARTNVNHIEKQNSFSKSRSCVIHKIKLINQESVEDSNKQNGKKTYSRSI